MLPQLGNSHSDLTYAQRLPLGVWLMQSDSLACCPHALVADYVSLAAVNNRHVAQPQLRPPRPNPTNHHDSLACRPHALVADYVMLATVDNRHVAQPQGHHQVGESCHSVGAPVHDVELSQDTCSHVCTILQQQQQQQQQQRQQ